MEHKSYENKKGTTAKEVIARVESYIIDEFDLEVSHFHYPNADGEYAITVATKHNIAKRALGQNKNFYVGIKDNAGKIDVRIGLGSWMNRAALVTVVAVGVPILAPIAVGMSIVGAKSQSDIMKSVWKYIDFCIDE